MRCMRRQGWVGPLVTLVVTVGFVSSAWGQIGGPFLVGPSFELSESVTVDEIPSPVRKHLEQLRAFLAGQQWDDAVGTLRRILEQPGEKVVAVDGRRYLNIRDYGHLISTTMPAEARDRYRNQVDPQARQWYEQALATRDVALLERVVAEFYASRWGDDALLALGDLLLESGDLSAARRLWEQLLPEPPPETGLPQRLTYPDSDIPRAAVVARLIVASALEGSLDRARREWDALAQHEAQAEGTILGRTGRYVDLLDAWLDETPAPQPRRVSDWPTFAGSFTRNRVVDEPIEPTTLAWSAPLLRSPEPEVLGSPRRIAETRDRPLSYHPIVVGNVVLVHAQENGADRLFAFDLTTGAPAWADNPLDLSGLRGGPLSAHHTPRLGTSRFTLSAHGDRVYVRLGSPVTSGPTDRPIPTSPGGLACLDLKAEGRLVWDIGPGDDRWSFEGPPVCDGTNLYIGMRRSDVRPQAHVACFDAERGRLKWRRWICSAEAPGQGQYELVTHNLLTLHEGTLYYNTNLGVIAALSTRTGETRWLYRYPRARGSSLEYSLSHFHRDLTPCVLDAGRVFVAPSDSRHIFALDSGTGQLLWETESLPDAVHLLGVSRGNLIATGNKAWWIRTDYAVEHPGQRGRAGKVFAEWPSGPDRIAGFGRGVLTGDRAYFPQFERLSVLDVATGFAARQPLELAATRQVTGGNLIVAGGHLLIANNEMLYAFRLSPETPATARKPE